MKHKHHIIPKHAGGTDDSSNLVELSVEEHADAHRILYEQHERWQDFIAWKTLSGQMSLTEASIAAWKEGCKRGGHATKPPLSKEAKENMRRSKLGEKNPMFGKQLSVERRRELSEKNKGNANPMYGKKHTDEMKAYLSEQRKLRHERGSKEGHYLPHTDDVKEKLRQANKAQFADPVKKEKHRQAMIEWASKRKER